MTDDELRDYYRKFGQRYVNELNDFLQKKQAWKMDPSKGEGEMLIAFDLIYTSTKHLWVSRFITEQEFFRVTDVLREL